MHQPFPSFLLHVIDRFAEPRENGITASNGRSTQLKVRISGLKLSPFWGFLVTDLKNDEVIMLLTKK